MNVVDRVQSTIEQVVSSFADAPDGKVELYDVEYVGAVLRIVLDRQGGIDVDTIGEVTAAISDALDASDPLGDTKYLLEVTSPGIERKLRLPRHFAAQLGNEVTIKTSASFEGPRRINGVLRFADEVSITVEMEQSSKQAPEGPVVIQIPLTEIQSARTVFHWGEQASSPKASTKKKVS